MDKDYFYSNKYENSAERSSENENDYNENWHKISCQDNVNEGSIEIIQDKLYFLSAAHSPVSNDDAYYFSTDDLAELEYEPFHKDFGPLKLSMMHRFCWELVRLLQDPEYSQNKIYHYWSDLFDKQVNGAWLIGCFMIVILKRSADDAWLTLKPYHKQLVTYRDSSGGPNTYKLSVYDVLAGLERAVGLGWYDFKTFDVHEYEYYEKVENGDLNWIIPGKFIALMGPSGKSIGKHGERLHTPEDYEPLFKALNVERVVRLNKAGYNKKRFTKFGFKFSDLYFLDGSTPSKEIVYEFIKIAEQTKKAIAVHCKAGLGRTGTLIGWYAMKKYGFPASEFIGWIRLVRPGSVLGPQQFFLEEMEEELHSYSNESPERKPRMPTSPYSRVFSPDKKKWEMSPLERQHSMYGDKSQATRLLSAKKMRENGKNRMPVGDNDFI